MLKTKVRCLAPFPEVSELCGNGKVCAGRWRGEAELLFPLMVVMLIVELIIYLYICIPARMFLYVQKQFLFSLSVGFMSS